MYVYYFDRSLLPDGMICLSGRRSNGSPHDTGHSRLRTQSGGAVADGDALTEAAGAPAACKPDLEPTAGKRKLRQQAAASPRLPAEPDDVVGSMVRRIFAAVVVGAAGGTLGKAQVSKSSKAAIKLTATAEPAVGQNRKRAADEPAMDTSLVRSACCLPASTDGGCREPEEPHSLTHFCCGP